VKIYWTFYAQNKILEIEDYYSKVARPIEEMLAHRKEKFRYLVYKNYKIIYWVNQEKGRIEIMNVFDCRQDEQKLLDMD